MPPLEYPLQDRLIDSRGMCPVYEDYKDRLRDESMHKPIKDLVKKGVFDNTETKELITLEDELKEDIKIFNRFEEKGLISIKTLVMKNPEARSKQEEIYLVLFLRIKHANIFQNFEKDALSLFVKRLSV